jgi:hypothetical protein
MSVEHHGPHERPRVFLDTTNRCFALMCSPHEGVRREVPAAVASGPTLPQAVYDAQNIVFSAAAAADRVEAEDEEWSVGAYAQDLYAEAGFAAPVDDETYQVRELAIAVLTAADAGAGFSVYLETSLEDENSREIFARMPSGAQLTASEGFALVTDARIGHVAHLIGYPSYLLRPTGATIIVHGPTPRAVLLDWDHDRFYFVDPSGRLAAAIRREAEARDYDVSDDDGMDCWGMEITPERLVACRAWLGAGAVGLPPASIL